MEKPEPSKNNIPPSHFHLIMVPPSAISTPKPITRRYLTAEEKMEAVRLLNEKKSFQKRCHNHENFEISSGKN